MHEEEQKRIEALHAEAVTAAQNKVIKLHPLETRNCDQAAPETRNFGCSLITLDKVIHSKFELHLAPKTGAEI